jgi:hypothetical protein
MDGMSTASSKTGGLTQQEIIRVVNRYIGVSGGYLGDFSYRSHADFYPEFCNLEIDPYQWEGTTRERFMAILSSLAPTDQAKVLRGVVERFPVGEGPKTRTEATRDEILTIIRRLELGPIVQGAVPQITSAVVSRAIADAESLLQASGPTSAVDWVHTALHGSLIAVCDTAGIAYARDSSMAALFKALRQHHPAFVNLGPRDDDIGRVLNSSAAIMDAMNPVRNRASVAHPNADLLGEAEARLVINVGRTLLNYLDAKLATSIG